MKVNNQEWPRYWVNFKVQKLIHGRFSSFKWEIHFFNLLRPSKTVLQGQQNSAWNYFPQKIFYVLFMWMFEGKMGGPYTVSYFTF